MKKMARRSKYNLEAMCSVGNEECPHCNAILSPSEYLRLDYERLQYGKCGEGLYSVGQRQPADADKLGQRRRVRILIKPSSSTPRSR